MFAPELAPGELVSCEEFLLPAGARPAVEEVAVPAVGGDEHILGPLPVRIAGEVGVLGQHRQGSAGVEEKAVVGTHREPMLAVVGGRGLRHQRIDVRKLPAHGKDIDVGGEEMLRGDDILKAAKGVEAFLPDFVVGPRQAADRLPAEVVNQKLGEVQLVGQERCREVKARRVVGDSHDVPALDTQRRHEVVQLIMPLAGRRFRHDAGQAA